MNIIPVIAKADTVSKSELDKLKIKIMSELVSNGVQIYNFPTEDEAVAEINSSMNVSFLYSKESYMWMPVCAIAMLFFMLQTYLPFAVVGSTEDVKVGNKMVKARLYPWGSVQGETVQIIVFSHNGLTFLI